MKKDHFNLAGKSAGFLTALVSVALLLAHPARLLAEGEKQFLSPEAAVEALKTAAAARDTNTLHEIFGPEAHELVSVDVVEATNELELFKARLAQKTALSRVGDSNAVLHVGLDGWAFPIPIVRKNDRWFFDTAAGGEEILNRRIGANEMGTIDVCHAYVQAQREYAAADADGDGILDYAQHLRSATGAHDGLYWPAKPGEIQSPLGPLVAQAHSEGYRREKKILGDAQNPYHGYYFKILTRQGKHAPGGKFNYIINGHMVAGFALVAWPAEWGNTGVMTFMVGQQGKIYQKNLGPKTASKAAGLSSYDPDATWTVVTD